VDGWLGGGPPGRAGRGRVHPASVGLVARVCRLCGGFLVPAALRGRARAGLSAGAEGVGSRPWRRNGLGLYGGGAGVAGNVGRTGRAHGDPTVPALATSLPATPFPRTQPMPLPRTGPQPTATAPPTDNTGAPPRQPTASGYDGNVARTGRRQRDCDVTVVYRRQRRIGRASGRFVRRYRRRRRHHRPRPPSPVPSPCRYGATRYPRRPRRRRPTTPGQRRRTRRPAPGSPTIDRDLGHAQLRDPQERVVGGHHQPQP
jgi:hypothetical protein